MEPYLFIAISFTIQDFTASLIGLRLVKGYPSLIAIMYMAEKIHTLSDNELCLS